MGIQIKFTNNNQIVNMHKLNNMIPAHQQINN